MEDKKLNELTDKALNAVTGGASYLWNMKTKLYDVFDRQGNLVESFAEENDALFATDYLTADENGTKEIGTIQMGYRGNREPIRFTPESD